ncbi:hypothetical protein CesoFtcFv8_012173 [Champsocephalus esox]|uniref:Secreted protein n=1 Tax=Champsocephalus esox TaxID=159716 RepID=A0AAN8GTQ6_9TELE|nr:hypothetical protein CesoFtcFv8_012173 [Champsocephalus esox]
MMNCAVILLLTSSCFTSSALYNPNRAVTSKLKYLLEPPVYAEVVARKRTKRHPAVYPQNQTQTLQSEVDQAGAGEHGAGKHHHDL